MMSFNLANVQIGFKEHIWVLKSNQRNLKMYKSRLKIALSPGQVGGKRAEQVERRTLTQAELTTGCSTLSSTDSKTALLSEHPGGRMSWE